MNASKKKICKYPSRKSLFQTEVTRKEKLKWLPIFFEYMTTAEFTVSKSKVGPISKRYVNGSFEEIEKESPSGEKRLAVVGLDNSHNGDYKVGYASDPLLTIKAGNDTSFDDIEQAMREVGAWGKANWTRVEFPDGKGGWRCGFKSLPSDSEMNELIYNCFESEQDEHSVLGSPDQFSVYW
jgi:hypothetical protein